MADDASSSNLARAHSGLVPFPVGWGLAGGLLAVLGFIAYAFAFELLVMPLLRVPGAASLSYGQQSGLTIIIAGALGFFGGASLDLCRSGHILYGWAVAILAAVPIAGIGAALWRASVMHNGPDPSDFIVYFPMVLGAITLALLPVALTIRHRTSSKEER